MKHYLFVLSLAFFVLVSCTKDDAPDRSAAPVSRLTTVLADSMDPKDFRKIDLTRIVEIPLDKNILIRIGIQGKAMSESFVLVERDENGRVLRGRLIDIARDTLTIRNLRGALMATREFRTASLPALRSDTEYDPYVTLPEVVIVSSYSSSGITTTTWFQLMSFLDNATGGFNASGSGWYNTADPFSGTSATGGSGTTAPTGNTDKTANLVLTEWPTKIDFESQYADPAIDISKVMACFSKIPDAGATGSIEIFCDLPVDGDPTKFFDWRNGSPGHVFLQLTKTNGSAYFAYNIGFYPVSGWKTALTNAPIRGKFVNNENHTFNASMKINLNTAQLQTAVTRMLYLAGFVRYDIDDYNCTDWALDVFNHTVKPTEAINDIIRFQIPGGMAPAGTSTPQSVYLKLQQLKQAGGTLAEGIQIPVIGWVGMSTSLCH